ncbi:MAG: HepT-like ribonuclease domain-containing protein [Thermodesulfobacteriota bacterium]
MPHDAVVRNLEVIGEAAAHIPDHVKAHAPDIDWVNIKGLRNVIAHRRFELDVDVLWDVAVQEAPDLLAKARVLHELKD